MGGGKGENDNNAEICGQCNQIQKKVVPISGIFSDHLLFM